jgi:diguanylate cyclase (GGDEF)-like protein
MGCRERPDEDDTIIEVSAVGSLPTPTSIMQQNAGRSVACLPGAAIQGSGSVPKPSSGMPRGGRRLVLLGLALFASACLGTAALLVHLHRRAISDAEREMSNIAMVLASYSENLFDSVQLLQDGLVSMVDQMGIESVEQFNDLLATREVNERLHAGIAALPQVDAAFLTNSVGQTIASTRAWPQPIFSIANRPHFLALQEDPDLVNFLAPPAQNAQTGTWNVYLTRRISAADGRFLGVAGVGLDLARFEAFLGSIALRPGSTIAAWQRNGTLMARFPDGAASLEGRPAQLRKPRFLPGLKATDAGIFRGPGSVDGVDRIIAFRALTHHPLVVTVSSSVAEVLALWWQQVVSFSAALLAVGLIIGATVTLGIRYLRDRDLLEQTRTNLTVLEERQRAAAEIDYLAHHDALTGLANRTLLRAKLDEAVAKAQRGQACAVLCLDLDHFKDVNDTFGHPAGDMLLCAVAERLRAAVRETDTIARLGGDEFAIIQTSSKQPHDGGVLAQRLVEALSAPFDICGNHVFVGTSIGIAVSPGDGLDADVLLSSADMALYRSKAAGRSRFRFFEPEMNDHAQSRLKQLVDLRVALNAGQFELFYQPIVHLTSGRIIGFEALIRWRHPERGLIMPDRFIALAEEGGLIVPLGEWVLRRACADAVTWPEGLRVAVNVSAIQFGSRALSDVVTAALNASGLSPERLELEITETALLRETESTLSTLHQLRSLGVPIALDDFGTGYSSLGYLQRFPFDRVKLDRSFVFPLGRAQASDAIVRCMISLCDALGISITAEGVETEEQHQLLAASGCHEAQGYLFGRPMTLGETQALLVSGNGQSALA